MSNNYATHLSPKEYNTLDLYDYGASRVLRTNYAKRIAKHCGVDYVKLEQVYATVYGSKWEDTSYNKLRSLAKVLPKLNVNECYYTPERISNDSMRRYRTEYITLEQTYAFRKAVRLFGKKNVAKNYSDCTIRSAKELASAVKGYRILKEVEGKTMANVYKANISTMGGIMRTYRSLTTSYCDKTPLDVLPEAMQNDVKKLAKEVAVLVNTKGRGESNWGALSSRLVEVITSRAAALKSRVEVGHSECYIEKEREKLSKAIANMYEMLELDKALNTIGLEIDKNRGSYDCEPRSYNCTKLDRRMVQAVKTVVSTSYDDEAKRAMVFDVFNKLDYERRNNRQSRNSWLPMIARCATKEDK